MSVKSHLLLNTSTMAALQNNIQTSLPQTDPEPIPFYKEITGISLALPFIAA